MLALARKEGSKTYIIINGGTPEEIKVEVDVIRISRGVVKLGFTAPKAVNIVRAEVYKPLDTNGVQNASPE